MTSMEGTFHQTTMTRLNGTAITRSTSATILKVKIILNALVVLFKLATMVLHHTHITALQVNSGSMEKRPGAIWRVATSVLFGKRSSQCLSSLCALLESLEQNM